MIPSAEIQIKFSRSSGPGGQNVNKTSTKVTVHWNIQVSRSFTFEQKNRLSSVLRNRINKNDELVVQVDQERSQAQNREVALGRLNDLVKRALIVRAKRKATRPTRGSKVRRLDSKRKHSLTKKIRKLLD